MKNILVMIPGTSSKEYMNVLVLNIRVKIDSV